MPTGLVDLHLHLLPGLDDGPATTHEALAMARVAWETGSRTLVATPHFCHPLFPHVDLTSIREAFAQLREAVAEATRKEPFHELGELELRLGAEHYLCPELLENVAARNVQPLGGGGSILVEIPPQLTRTTIRFGLERILEAGYRPLVAHVERVPALIGDRQFLSETRAAGCALQVNVGALRQAPRELRHFLREGLIDVIASDGHDLTRRPPVLGTALEQLLAPADVERFGVHGPRLVLDGTTVSKARPDRPARRGGALGRLERALRRTRRPGSSGGSSGGSA